MLSCRDLAHQHASDYLDGQLGWRARLGVRVHLLLCENCRRFIAQMRKARALLRKRPLTESAMQTAPETSAQTAQLADDLARVYVQQKRSPPL